MSDELIYGPFISRKQAQEQGLKRYFTGKACPRGHVEPRYTSNRKCVLCTKIGYAQFAEKRRQERIKAVSELVLICQECNNSFTPEYGHGKKVETACYCSEECADIANRRAQKDWAINNPERVRYHSKKTAQKITEEKGLQWKKQRKRSDERIQRLLATDPDFRLAHNLRNLLNQALNRSEQAKSSSVLQLIGCSVPELRKHLESLFEPGMSWENRKEWHIDHIKPLRTFKRKDDPEAWHYSNLQPLWAKDNLQKSGKWDGEVTA